MNPATRTPEGEPHQCPVCGKAVVLEPSRPSGDAPCPHCGTLLWFPPTSGGHLLRRWTITDSHPTKEGVIAALLDRLVADGALTPEQRPQALAVLLKREQLGSTGIGRGVALPHAICQGLKHIIGVMADCPAGVDFDSVDGAPVRIICLVLSPTDRPGDHLRTLEALARSFR